MPRKTTPTPSVSPNQNGKEAAVYVSPDSLVPWKDNPRKNDGEPVRKVAESIRRFGFGAPILARRDNGEIIAGHTRWKAARDLPCPEMAIERTAIEAIFPLAGPKK